MNMKLKFFIAGVAIVAGLASAVSCQDISKDLTALQNKVASLESTVQSLQAKIDAGAVITSVTPSNSGIKITLSNGNSYEITNGVNGKDGTNGKDGKDGKDGTPGSVVTIGANGNWFIDGVDTGLAAEGKDGADGKDGHGEYYVPNPETGCFDKYVWVEENGEGAYKKEATTIPFIAEGAITAVYDAENNCVVLYGVEGWIGGYVIGSSVSPATQPTGEIAIDPATTDGTKTYVGGKLDTVNPGLTVVTKVDNDFYGMVFTKGDELAVTKKATITVSPVDAVLTPGAVTFEDSKGNVLPFVKATNVEKVDDNPITKAETSATWTVEFAYDIDNYDEDAFLEATLIDPSKGFTGGNRIAFAMKAGEAATDYVFIFDEPAVAAEQSSAALLAATVGTAAEKKAGTDVAVSTLKNRVADQTWLASKKDYETPAVATKGDGDASTAAKAAKTNYNAIGDARLGGSIYKAVLDTEFNFYAPDVAGLYVELDMANVTDQSEKVAWEKYAEGGIKGLGLTEGNTVGITIVDPAALNDEIVFRVHAVNHSGTLVDPDGVAFTILVGQNSQGEWGAVETVVVPAAANDYATINSGYAAITTTKLSTSTTTVTITKAKTTDPAFDIAGYYDADKKPLASPGDWSKVAYLKTKPAAGGAYTDYLDNVVYEATATVKDGNGYTLATFPISFKKDMESVVAPGVVITKKSVLVDNTLTLYAEDYVATTASAGFASALTKKTAYYNELISSTATDVTKATTKKAYWDATPTATSALNLSKIYSVTLPTGMAAGNVIATIPAVDYALSSDSKKVENKAITVADNALTTNINIQAVRFDGSKQTVSIDYDFGTISSWYDADKKVVKTAKVTKNLSSFDVVLTTQAKSFTFGMNWDEFGQNSYQIDAAGNFKYFQNYSARTNYNNYAFYTNYHYDSTLSAWVFDANFMKEQNDFVAETKTDGVNTWYTNLADDTFDIHHNLEINFYNEAPASMSMNVAGFVYAENSYKASLGGYLDNWYVGSSVPNLLYIPEDSEIKVATLDKNAASAYKLSNEDYFTVTKPVGINYLTFTKQDAYAPTAPQTATLTIKAFDVAQNAYSIPVTVVINPAE